MREADADKNAEIDQNLDSFLQILPSVRVERQGQCALMRRGEIIEYFPSAIEAQVAGNQRFADGLFSIQEVQAFAEELGCFAHALASRVS